MMMRMAELRGYRRHNSNPCRNTRRYRMEPRERFLTADEMARLNAVLTRDEFWYPHVVAVIRLLMLTGYRFGEIVTLEWDWIRDKRIHLPGSKSGPRTVWLSSAARGHRRHPAIQPRLPVSLSGTSADAAHRQHRIPVGPHPRRGGIARIANS